MNSKIRTDFDAVAGGYPLLEQIVFGSDLDRARRSFIDRTGNGKRILLVGEGNGRFLAALLHRKKAGSITVVDSSAKMLAALRRRIQNCPGQERVQIVKADFLRWKPPVDRFDEVTTHFFLDLFEPPKIALISQKIVALSTEEGIWVDVDFTSRPNDGWYQALMWTQYRFFRLLAGIEAARWHDPWPAIQEAGWRTEEERQFASERVKARLMKRGGEMKEPGVRSRDFLES